MFYFLFGVKSINLFYIVYPYKILLKFCFYISSLKKFDHLIIAKIEKNHNFFTFYKAARVLRETLILTCHFYLA